MKEEKEVINEETKKELSDRKKYKLKKYAEKYKSHKDCLLRLLLVRL
ncbi:MAG: hypothetical protein ACI31V_05640 [Bacilli bacterium]